jgi:hypothetical protein
LVRGVHAEDPTGLVGAGIEQCYRLSGHTLIVGVCARLTQFCSVSI